MLILRWGYIPNEVRHAVDPLLKQYLWLVPGWCRQLGISYSPNATEGDASCSSDPEYRQGWIYIHPGWMDANPTQRRLDIIHELLHLPTAPMVKEHSGAVDRMFEDGDAPKFKATLHENWRRAFEGTVQDLAFAIMRIPEGALPHVECIEEEDEHPPLKASA